MPLAERPRADGDPVAGFGFYLRRERELSGATERAYLYWVNRWLAWCSHEGVSSLSATPIHVRTFSTSGDWSRKTRSQILSALRAFYRYAELDGFTDRNPAQAVAGPRLFQRRGPSYSTDQARRLLGMAVDLTDKLIVGLGLFAGVRTGEGMGLEPNDLDLHSGLLHIRRTYGEPTTKGKRERTIPLHSWLREPLAVARRVADGRLIDVGEDAYRARFRRVCQRAHIPYHGPHALRRTFSTALTKLGVREGVVRELMGHRPTVTDLYIEVSAEEARRAIRGLRY